MENGAGRGLFLDRDGVINEESGYLHRIEDVRFVTGIFSLCRVAKSLEYKIFVVTNQAGIGRGLYTKKDFQTLTAWMSGEFAKEHVSIDAVYHSPVHPEHGVGEYKRDHADRKPGIGMLQRAEREFRVALSASVMVGDRCTDIQAANAAGLRQAFLLAGTEQICPGQYLPVLSLAAVEQWLIQHS